MDTASLHAMGDELTKLAGIADRDYVKDRARQAGGYAKKNWGNFKGWFNKRGPVGQAGVVGGIMGGVAGGIRGAAKNDPQIDWNTGEMKKPSLATRAGRGAKGALTGGASGAAMSAGGTYLVRKLTHP